MSRSKVGRGPGVKTRRCMFLWMGLMLPCGLTAQKPPAITGISHVVLYANDVQRSKEFYGGLLGWVPESIADTPHAMRFYANHEQYVEVVPPPSPSQPDRLRSVGFATSDANALRRYLGSKGVAVPDSLKTDPRGDRSFEV